MTTPITRRSFTSRVLAALAGIGAGITSTFAARKYSGVLDAEGREWHQYVLKYPDGSEVPFSSFKFRESRIESLQVDVASFETQDEAVNKATLLLTKGTGFKVYRLEHGREVLFWPKEAA